jgi:Fe-S oxidoreductase
VDCVTWVLILGLIINLIALPLAAKRVAFLARLITSGQPAPDRVEGVTTRLGLAVKTQVVEVFGQKKLLKWSVPGAAHFFVFWAFIILGSVYVEAYGSLFTYPEQFAIPIVGTWDVLGFAQDFIAVMALVGLAVFARIRLREDPKKLGRRSRFKGSHLGGAWVVLFMIFNVIWTMFLFRGAAAAHDNFPYGNGAFVSQAVGSLLSGLSSTTLEVLEGIGLMLHIGVMLVFLIIVLNSKHLHIFVAPLNVLFSRRPVALGAAKPLMSDGKVLNLEDADDFDEDTKLGVGAVEDFTWKGMLDFATCTECGRCQSQCPAWNTEKPLSPKLLIMGLRDAAFAKAPYSLASEEKRGALLEKNPALAKEAERPLVGDTGDEWFYMPEDGSAVIDPDVLWSCVTCGACVEQCPVDIEHVDHIVDMRRYQVLIESNFPAELNGLFKQMENKGNPWGMSAKARMDWAKDLDFPVKVVGEDVESLDEVEWLFWVGCAGAYEDRAKKTTAAVAELLNTAGVDFAVLGNGETCTGDSARRAGNEFLFQQLAMENAATLTEAKAKKVVSTCAHCFNTLKNEYAEFGVELDVVHHTQLLNSLVREGRLTPVAPNGGPKRTLTYHDPCYVGRHNQVYTPPRELLSVIPSTEFKEMERNSERSFCCGAGGARMWMEENIGERINVNRTTEAVGTGAEQIAVGCPFCRVMLSDGLTALQDKGEAREEVEVLDVAQLLLASVKRETDAGLRTTGDEPVGDGDEKADDTAYPSTVAHEAEPESTPVTEPEAEPATAQTTQPTSPHPAGVIALWDNQDVESILEGDEVDISEFKAKLKAELKAEVLAEVKAELEGALNSESGTSEPVEVERPEAQPPASEKPAAAEPEKKPEPAPAAEKPAPAAEKPAAEEKAAPESKPTAEKSDKPDDEDDDGSLLIGSL